MRSIMQVNSQIRNEAAKAFHRNNSFHFREQDFFHFVQSQDRDLTNCLQKIALVTDLYNEELQVYDEQVYNIATMQNIRHLDLIYEYYNDLYECTWTGIEIIAPELLNLLRPVVDAREKHRDAESELGLFQLILGAPPRNLGKEVRQWLENVKDSGQEGWLDLLETFFGH